LAGERGQDPVAVRVLAGRTAERPGQRRPSAEPRDRDRGVGGAAAIDDEKTVRLGFCVRLRKAIDPEHLVEHDDPGAQDRARAATGASGTQPLPPPTNNNIAISNGYEIVLAVPINQPAKACRISGVLSIRASGPRYRHRPRSPRRRSGTSGTMSG